MQVTMDVRTLALGIAIGVAGMAWAGPQPAIAAGSRGGGEVLYEYKSVATPLYFHADAQANKLAADGWEPVLAEGNGWVLFRRAQ